MQVLPMLTIPLQPVDYLKFRQILDHAAGSKIRNRGRQTYLYDKNGFILAILERARLEKSGRIQPARYLARPIAA